MTADRATLAGVPSLLNAGGTRVEQIFRHLQHLVASLPTGAELPSERAVADHFGVARMTAREAVDRLVDAGLAERGLGVARSPGSRASCTHGTSRHTTMTSARVG